MLTMEATKARKTFSQVISRVCFATDRVLITRSGKEVAAVVSMGDLRLLELLEDHIDLEAARKALADPHAAERPWEDVKAELGL
jgi:antitoxin Phd